MLLVEVSQENYVHHLSKVITCNVFCSDCLFKERNEKLKDKICCLFHFFNVIKGYHTGPLESEGQNVHSESCNLTHVTTKSLQFTVLIHVVIILHVLLCKICNHCSCHIYTVLLNTIQCNKNLSNSTDILKIHFKRW